MVFFLISSMVLGLLDQLQIFLQLYLIELLGLLTGLGLLKPLVNILAKNPYFFPTPKFWNPYFFFISEKFVVVIIVIIFTYVFVEY